MLKQGPKSVFPIKGRKPGKVGTINPSFLKSANSTVKEADQNLEDEEEDFAEVKRIHRVNEDYQQVEEDPANSYGV